MSLRIGFQAEARAELVEAAAWYEARRPGLGAESIAEIERCIDSAALHPTAYPVVHTDLRCVVVRRFP
ncbi:MAG: hypothetical protein ABI364_03465 [Caldimonas sp.]